MLNSSVMCLPLSLENFRWHFGCPVDLEDASFQQLCITSAVGGHNGRRGNIAILSLRDSSFYLEDANVKITSIIPKVGGHGEPAVSHFARDTLCGYAGVQIFRTRRIHIRYARCSVLPMTSSLNTQSDLGTLGDLVDANTK